jgi:molybdopterin synthase catalytic subunit
VRLSRPDSDRRARRATRGGDRSPTFGAGRRAVVLVVSTSAAAGTAEDSAGPVLVGWLQERGYEVDGAQIVPDGPEVGRALAHHLHDLPEAQRPRVLVTTGGTGLAPDDATPEETRRFLDKEATGIAHALVDFGLAKLPEAAMSRGTAGSAGRTFVVNLPGSVGGVKDGITVLDPILHHIQAQLEDGLDGRSAADDGVHPPREQVGGADAGAASAAATGTEAVAGSQESAGFTTPAVDRPAADGQVTGDSGADAVPEAGSDDAVATPFARLTSEPLDRDAAQAHVLTTAMGAVALFRGVVRDHDSGRSGVVGLEYTALPDAGRILGEVLAEVHADFPDVRLWAEHRLGRLAVGDDALVVVVASAHRREAFAACAELVDRIKARVPIWKKQDYADGTHDWVGIE